MGWNFSIVARKSNSLGLSKHTPNQLRDFSKYLFHLRKLRLQPMWVHVNVNKHVIFHVKMPIDYFSQIDAELTIFGLICFLNNEWNVEKNDGSSRTSRRHGKIQFISYLTTENFILKRTRLNGFEGYKGLDFQIFFAWMTTKWCM